MTKRNSKLSIIIVSWNVRRDLCNCLRSIEENPPSYDYEVIVVDNASTDGTIETIKEKFPKIKLIVNNENRGFAAANNLAIPESQGKYILFLNPDTIVHKNALDVLIEFMDNNDKAGACGPKLLNSDGTIQPSTRHFPDFYSALYQNTVFRNIGIFRKQYQRYRMSDFSFNEQVNVDILMGAAIMTRRSIIDEIGAMDENFFMYYEEADLCYRIIAAGWNIVFVPNAAITHLGGSSSDQIPIKTHMMKLKSLLTYFRKHKGRFKTGIYNCIFKPAIILRYVFNFLVGIFIYIFAAIISNKKRREKHAQKIRLAAKMLGRYSWQLFFKM
ncbi:MAG: glycosyltransferase family 2 protein [Sedimentisphaerales bacterium]|nr:glycosyltransferase family 2 protein [Sedimentisphaerales bacterium]